MAREFVMNYKIGDRPDDGAWIHSELDDFGLSLAEFRVYCHILRRAGTGAGHYWEGSEKAAKLCRTNRHTYDKALATLERYRMIHVQKRKGETSMINPLAKHQWQKPDPRSNEADRTCPNEAVPCPNEADRTCPNEADRTCPNEADKVTPNEVTPNEVIKNPLTAPLKGERVKNADHFFQEKEQDENEEAIASASANASEQAIPSGQNPTDGSDRYSAPRRFRSKVEKSVRRKYPETPPPWRIGYDSGEYFPGFVDSVHLRWRSKDSSVVRSMAVERIENAELDGKFATLEQDFAEWQAKTNGLCVESESTISNSRYHAEIECPNDGQHYQENPVIDLSHDVSLVDAHWRRLELSIDDERWITWLEKVDPDQDPADGRRNLPDWILRKLAEDLRKTPC
jgi:hypothetical protein